MNMRNVIRLEGVEGYASGMIFPVNNDSSKYIVITAAHLIVDYKTINKEIENIRDNPNEYIRLEVFDIEDNLVENTIESIFIGNSIAKEDDVLALLVEISGKYELHLNKKMELNFRRFKDEVEVEWFPNTIRDSDVCNKIIMNGKLNPIDRKQKQMGSYRIIDDYHYYEGLKDLTLLEGLSGAPVINSGEMIIGMNQSIPISLDGENPYKIICFITMEQILKCLREEGCIIYEVLNQEINIKWIYKETFAECKDISTLVIGGSGAGKSSFIKNFAWHKDLIDSSGDGQTTRSDVEYKFSIWEEEPKIKIDFLNLIKFCEKRNKDIELDIISYIFVNKLGFKEKDIYQDKLCYLKEIHRKLILIKKDSVDKENEFDKEIKNLLIKVQETIYFNTEDAVDAYKTILNTNILIEVIKKVGCIFNDDELNNIYKKVQKAKIFGDESNKIIVELSRYLEEWTDIEKVINGIYKIVKERDDNSEFGINIKNTKEENKKKLKKIIKYKQGFFSINEFKYLFSDEDEYNYFEGRIDERIEILDKEIDTNIYLNENIIPNFDYEGKKDNGIYNYIYSVISEKVEKCYGISKDTKKISIPFNELDEYDGIMTKALKVEVGEELEHKSITAYIDKITIEDSISDMYVVMIENLNIKTIRFLDTYGLDHIEKGIDKKNQLQNFLSKMKEDKENNLEKGRSSIDAVFYIKKLDSGRPTELEQIIPTIYEIEPSVALYCIFTGADIFGIQNKKYRFNKPKNVIYLESEELGNYLINKMPFSEERTKQIHYVLQKRIAIISNLEEKKYSISNKEYIREILISIIMKEKDSINIISREVMEKIKKDEKIEKELEKLMLLFFKEASIVNWENKHHMTIKANKIRIENGELGYWGTYRHRWDLLFNDAYNKIFSEETEVFIEQISKTHKEKLEAILINLKEDFLGKSIELYEKNKGKENILRQILDEKLKSMNLDYINTDKDYLNNRTNFYSLFKEDEKKINRVVEFYKKKLIVAIEIDRKESFKNILNYVKGVDRILFETMKENIDKSSISMEKVMEKVVEKVVR